MRVLLTDIEVKVNHFSEVTPVANAAKSVRLNFFSVEHKFIECIAIDGAIITLVSRISLFILKQ